MLLWLKKVAINIYRQKTRKQIRLFFLESYPESSNRNPTRAADYFRSSDPATASVASVVSGILRAILSQCFNQQLLKKYTEFDQFCFNCSILFKNYYINPQGKY